MLKLSFLERVCPSTGRTLDEYLKKTNLSDQDLEGKRILNLGSGVSNLGDELAERGIRANVVNIDLRYISNRKSIFWNFIFKMRLKDYPSNAVRADMAALPFLDRSFDITFASWSLSSWLPFSKTRRALTEAARVTNENIYIFPYDKRIDNLDYPPESSSWDMQQTEGSETLVISERRKSLLYSQTV